MNTHFSVMSIVILLLCSVVAQADAQESSPQVLIIRAAGYIEGQESQTPDALTEATSFGRNVYVVSEAVADELNNREIDTVIVPYTDTDRIQSLIDEGVGLIVFAGPAYSSRYPEQLQDCASGLCAKILKTETVCASLATCRFLESGGEALQVFDGLLKEQGIATIEGLLVHHEYEDEDWEAKVQAFAERIQQSL